MLENIVLVVGGICAGLLAGLFYAFPVAFVPALRALKADQHIKAMQALNVKIENPLLFVCFFGPTVLLPLAAYLHRVGPGFGLLVAASILHIAGANGVTIAGNIPLNNRLAKVDTATLSEAGAEKIRAAFQGPGSLWMRLHAARTLASIAATACVILACLL